MVRWTIGLAAMVLLMGQAEVPGAVVNGGFETGFDPGWGSVGHAAIATTPAVGLMAPTKQALVSNGPASVSPGSIEAFLNVPAGTLATLGLGSDAQGSAIRQTGIMITEPGDQLSLDFSLVGCGFLAIDPSPDLLNSVAFYTLEGEGFLVIEPLSAGFLPPAMPFGGGISHLTATTGPLEPGEYTLGIGLLQAPNAAVGGGLLVDNVMVNPEPSTFIVWTLLGVIGIAAGWQRRKRKA